MNRTRIWPLAMAVLLQPHPAWAWPPRFGLELTFTHEVVLDGLKSRANTYLFEKNLLASATARAEALCKTIPGCRVMPAGTGHERRIMLESGFWVSFSKDPGVIEVHTAPATATELRQEARMLQKLVFDVVAVDGMAPHAEVGGGHMHIGVAEAFGEDLLAYRNFVVDQANRPELAHWIFGADMSNAAPISFYGKPTWDRFTAVIRDVDEGRITSIQSFAEALVSQVYQRTTTLSLDRFFAGKKHAQNFWRITSGEYEPSQWTHELRNHRAQRSANEVAVLAEIYEGRIRFLTGKPPVRLKTFTEVSTGRSQAHDLRYFAGFLKESNVSWKKGLSVLPDGLSPNLRVAPTPLSTHFEGPVIQTRRFSESCKALRGTLRRLLER